MNETHAPLTRNLYSIFDKITNAHAFIFTAYNDPDAERTFHASGQQLGTNLNLNPHDFMLYRLGSYNEETGEIFPQNKKVIASYIIINKNIEEEQTSQENP